MPFHDTIDVSLQAVAHSEGECGTSTSAVDFALATLGGPCICSLREEAHTIQTIIRIHICDQALGQQRHRHLFCMCRRVSDAHVRRDLPYKDNGDDDDEKEQLTGRQVCPCGLVLLTQTGKQNS